MRELHVILAVWASGCDADSLGIGTRVVDDPLRRQIYQLDTDGREWWLRNNIGRSSECPAIIGSAPDVELDSSGLEGNTTHAVAAAGAASLVIGLAGDPAIQALEYYVLEAHMAVAWWTNGRWLVPHYRYERDFYDVESVVVDDYRGALVEQLQAKGVGFLTPRFDVGWAGDESHRVFAS